MANTEADDLRQIARNIEQLGKNLEEASLSPSDKVALAQALYLVTRRSDTILSALKEALRDEAIRRSGGQPGPQVMFSDDGSKCTVMIFPPVMKSRKDADWQGLKAALGARFVDLFDEVTTFRPRKDFQEQAASLDPAHMQAVMNAVDMVADTPKVYFKDD